VAHNSIRRQEDFPIDEPETSTPAMPVEPTQHLRKDRKPNRNRSCSRTAADVPLRRPASARLPMSAEAQLQLAQAEAIDRPIVGFATHDPTVPCRVLIVDDDDLIISRVSSLLERSGYQVCTARSGEDALRILDSMTCHIVITDWHMPDMDGLDLCRDIRSRAEKAYIYVLMLTVRNGNGDILAALSAGADDYVVKGATAEEILARLEVGRRLN
jgi:PleD family two-component response regulator